ncbi:MAG: glycerate kinase [Candidatus Bathyarchaeota archaeon]|nr:glycerate kinase [Candidatus Bathyarchaeota archaeon]
MMIKNRGELLAHGLKEGRRVALDVIEHALMSVDPYQATKRVVQRQNNRLFIGSQHYNLKDVRNLYVIGAGKASFPIAKALEDVLGDRIARGVVIVKRGQGGRLKRIKKVEAGHPLPDEDGLRGAEEVMEIADEAGSGDLVFAAITGGSSALMPLPAENITLEEAREVNELLLHSGAVIQEINAVRKHISRIKGGRLALHIHPAEIINLTVSDVIGDWNMLDYITGNTVPDSSTFQDAINSLKKYRLLEKMPESVRSHLQNAHPETETPKHFREENVYTVILATNEDACLAAAERAEALGFNAMILSTRIEGESREAGIVHAGIARELEVNDRPLRTPCVLISGGETTVTIEGDHGEGGPNQEFVLGFATKIGGSKRIIGVSMDTDGTDGPTDVAGGVVDGLTLERAEAGDINIHESLMRHNAYSVLKSLGDTIYTGSTGTNVMNLRLIIVLE